jgi:hypothetical protein
MRLPAAAVLVCYAVGCGPHPAADMTSCVPEGTTVLGSLDLDHLRASPLYRQLPPAAVALAQGYQGAQRLLAAWNGSDVIMIIRGTSSGATTVAPNLAVSGSDQMIRAAVSQYRTGKTGSPGLVDYAARVAGRSPIWIAARGGVTLPLAGNARNLNRLFRDLEYASLTIDLTSALELRINASGRTEQAAREFEENLRGFLSLASAAENRRPDIAKLLDSVQIRRQGASASASLSIPAGSMDGLLAPLTR